MKRLLVIYHESADIPASHSEGVCSIISDSPQTSRLHSEGYLCNPIVLDISEIWLGLDPPHGIGRICFLKCKPEIVVAHWFLQVVKPHGSQTDVAKALGAAFFTPVVSTLICRFADRL